MSTIKLTPLWLFLILLAILIFSILFLKKGSTEGLINYQVQTVPGLAIQLPNYNNSLVKLFDNDYFDPKNGNVLRIYGAENIQGTSTVDNNGSSIDYIDLLDRNNIVQQYSQTQSIPVYLTTVPSSYNTWNTYTTDPKYTTITSNELFYIAWDTYTYLHVIDMANNKHASGYIFTQNSSANIPSSFNVANYSKTINTPMPSFKDVNSNNNTFVIDTRLNNNYHLYQLCSTVYYNQNTGDLVLGNYLGYPINTSQQISKNYIYYDKNGNQISCFSNSNVSVTNNSWVLEDTVGNNIIIYVNLPNSTTIISVLQKNTDDATYNLVDVKRFLSNGGVQSNASTILPNPDAAALGTITYNCNSIPPASTPIASAPSGTPTVPAPSGTPTVPTPSGTPSARAPSGTPSTSAPSGSLCNAQTVVDGLNKSIDDYNTLFTGLNSLQQNMQNTMSKFNNASNNSSNNASDNSGCNSSSCDMGCGSNQYDGGSADVNLINDASLGYTDFLNNANMNGMNNVINTSSSVVTPTNINGGSGIASLLSNTGTGTNNLMTGVGVGTGNLMTGVGVGTGNLMTGVGAGTGNLMTGVGAGTGNLMTGVGAGTGNLMTGVGVGTENLLTGVGAGTGNLLTGVGVGTENLLTGVGAGTGNLLTGVGAGTGNLLTGVGAGTGNLMTDVGVGTGNLMSLNSNSSVSTKNNNKYNVSTGINNPLNPLTYNGALVEKPSSDFIPVLTDFSRFGK
jgi:hypothetical protein